MSGLSAGELDILVTITLILAQQLAIKQKFGVRQFDEAHGPGGFVFIDEIDSHLHPQWQERVVPLLHELFPNVFFIFTTHSPFVLRSLPKGQSIVVRLPDGEVFSNEFSAWPVEDILKLVFEVQPEWSQDIKARLMEFERLVKDPDAVSQAFDIYAELSAHDSEALRAECRRISALYGSRPFQERVATEDKPIAATV
jgi:predicted ATP-binding protein involved in virulence